MRDSDVGPLEAETRLTVSRAKVREAVAGLVTFTTLAVVALTVLAFVAVLR